jgi:hypothetical protein
MAAVLVASLVGAVLAWRLPRSHHASQPATSDDKTRRLSDSSGFVSN